MHKAFYGPMQPFYLVLITKHYAIATAMAVVCGKVAGEPISVKVDATARRTGTQPNVNQRKDKTMSEIQDGRRSRGPAS